MYTVVPVSPDFAIASPAGGYTGSRIRLRWEKNASCTLQRAFSGKKYRPAVGSRLSVGIETFLRPAASFQEVLKPSCNLQRAFGGKKMRPAVGRELSVGKNIVLPSAAGFLWEKITRCRRQQGF
jgi:hypothetical protein